MSDIFQIVSLVLLLAITVLLLMLLKRSSRARFEMLASRLDGFEKTQERVERATREEAAQSRDELNKAAREQRQELTETFKTLGDSVAQRIIEVANLQKGQLEIFSGQLNSFAKASGDRLDAVRSETASCAKQLREEVVNTLSSISETMAKMLKDLAIA